MEYQAMVSGKDLKKKRKTEWMIFLGINTIYKMVAVKIGVILSRIFY